MKRKAKSYYANEVAKMIGNGCTGKMVGIIANAKRLKVEENGYFVDDVVVKGKWQRNFSTFKYYEHAVEIIREAYFLRKGLV